MLQLAVARLVGLWLLVSIRPARPAAFGDREGTQSTMRDSARRLTKGSGHGCPDARSTMNKVRFTGRFQARHGKFHYAWPMAEMAVTVKVSKGSASVGGYFQSTPFGGSKIRIELNGQLVGYKTLVDSEYPDCCAKSALGMKGLTVTGE